jgi:hypothetical protein
MWNTRNVLGRDYLNFVVMFAGFSCDKSYGESPATDNWRARIAERHDDD